MLTAVEKLDADHPGLQRAIDNCFLRGLIVREIPLLLQEQFKIWVPLRQLWSYRHKRWCRRLQRINREAERLEAMIRVFRRERRSAYGRGHSWRRRDLAKVMSAAARELYGDDWQEALRTRLLNRFATSEPIGLTFAQARSEIESLISLLALARSENRKVVRGLLSARIYGDKHDG